jgi:outer membrane protein TolC
MKRVPSWELSENAEPISNLPPAIGSLVDTSFERYALNLDAAWELDFWGRFRRGVESADANLAATIATYDDFLVTLTGEVATAYVLLRTLEERLAYARSNVAVQQRSYEIADVRFRNGLVTELDVQLARTLLGNTKATIPFIETGIRKAKLALSVLLGMPPGDLRDILGGEGTIPVSPENVAVGIPADLLRRRPDIRSCRRPPRAPGSALPKRTCIRHSGCWARWAMPPTAPGMWWIPTVFLVSVRSGSAGSSSTTVGCATTYVYRMPSSSNSWLPIRTRY